MRLETEMFGLAAVGSVLGFLVVLLAAVVAFQMNITVALPVASAIGLAAGVAIYVWLRASTDRPDPMLG